MADIVVDLTNPVPDVCEIVEYDGDAYRVTGWWKLVPIKPANVKGTNSSVVVIHNEIIEDLRRKDPTSTNHKLIRCHREEATVIEIVSVGGGLFRISEVTRVGKYVDWDNKLIEEHRQAASLLDEDGGLGRGYKDTLQRLFPEIDFTYR